MNRRKPQNRPKPPPKPATREPRANLRAWREQHLYGLFSSLGRLAARPWSTALTLLVMALALTLPLLLYLLLDNARTLHGDMRAASAISVFVKPGTAPAAVEALAREVRTRPGVAAVEVRTPEQGLAEFRNRSGFAQALDLLHDNPLPAVLLVAPADPAPAAAAALADALGRDAAVDLVRYDAGWRARLDAILATAARVTEVVAALLALALLLVVGNTVRMDIAGRAEEIEVMQLLGATRAFVRRPFLYVGFWYGAFSALLAIALTLAVEAALAEPLQQLAASYAQRFAVHGLGLADAAVAFATGALLGWLGAFAAASRHLARTRA
jgi:cell division transport system permease protein